MICPLITVSAKALRLYEARGLLLPDAHSDAGYRLYGAPALARLNEVGVLKRAGFTLAEIGKLLQRKGSAAAVVEARIVALRVFARFGVFHPAPAQRRQGLAAAAVAPTPGRPAALRRGAQRDEFGEGGDDAVRRRRVRIWPLG